MSDIPTKARELVRERQNGQCARCGVLYSDLHHRQRRREAGHAVGILVGLCRNDHRWAHANPSAAKRDGYIIDPHENDPQSVPLKSFMGWVLFDDDGNVTFTEEKSGEQ